MLSDVDDRSPWGNQLLPPDVSAFSFKLGFIYSFDFHSHNTSKISE